MSGQVSTPAQPQPGDRFGKLVVIRRIPNPVPRKTRRPRGPRYECRCDCGIKLVFKGSQLRRGERTSCDRCAGNQESKNG